MNKKWPFGFFVYSSLDEKEEAAQAEPEVVEAETEVVVEEAVQEAVPEEEVIEDAEEVEAIEADVEEVLLEEDELSEEDDEDPEEDDDADLPDLEEELEIALEEAHKEEVAKQRTIFKGVTASLAILGAVGLATGLSIRAYLKKK